MAEFSAKKIFKNALKIVRYPFIFEYYLINLPVNTEYYTPFCKSGMCDIL